MLSILLVLAMIIKGFWRGESQILGFSIDLHHHHYNSLTILKVFDSSQTTSSDSSLNLWYMSDHLAESTLQDQGLAWYVLPIG